MRSRPLSAALVAASLATAAHAQQVRWTSSLDAALALAAEQGTVVLIAIQMPGERASDEMLADHYSDAKIAELGRHTVNLLLEVGPKVGAPPADERLVRDRYLKVGPEELLPVPHHLFVRPGGEDGHGTLLSSFAYRVTIGQLEWAWADAIRQVKPEFEWMPSERSRAPESLLYGESGGTGTPVPPTREEVEEAIEALEKGRARFADAMEKYRVILASDDRDAVKFGEQRLRALNGMMLRGALRTIGDVSPRAWHSCVESYVDHRDTETREEAARALEALAEPKSLKPLRKQLGSEDEDVVRGRLLRAMVVCGPDDKAVAREVERALGRKEHSADVRAQAAVAAGQLEDREKAVELLRSALADSDPKVRTAACYAVAARRDAELVALLDERGEAESDATVAQWLATAREVIEGGDLRAFSPVVEQVLHDRERGEGLRRMREQLDRWRRPDPEDEDDADAGLPEPEQPPR